MFKDNTPSFVRFFIVISTAVLLGLFILPPSGSSSTGATSASTGPRLVKERLSQRQEPDDPVAPTRKIVVIRKGDHFSGILEKAGISKGDALYIARKAGKVYRLGRMLPGSELELYFTPDGKGLQEVDYKVNNRTRLVLYNGKVIHRETRATLKASRSSIHTSAAVTKKLPVPSTHRKGTRIGSRGQGGGETVSSPSAGQQTDRISPAGTEAAVTPKIPSSMRLVTLYAPGACRDTVHPYQMSYGLLAQGKVPSPVTAPWDTKSLSGEFSRPGERTHRFAASHAKHRVKAVTREDKFKKKSRIAQRAAKRRHLDDGFLKAPLAYRYISSGFTSRRIHPITNNAQPHYGIDYAAPRGTPVHAIGSGQVIFMGWDGGFGKTIRIRHRNGYISHYGHLSRYTRGVRVGKRINRGEIIGNVGMTGLATGPHLDFRITHRGSFINPAGLEQHLKRLSSQTTRRTRG
ncbi:MAG: M23 family metallopeptidase [Desulfobacterota bacterium]|nr:M23 family metallopeptidase [Thermodesulfobacteriota bacterium]